MGDERIDGLLEKLKEMDPETWTKFDRLMWFVKIHEINRWIPDVIQDTLQGVVQEAIAAQAELEWRVSHVKYHGKIIEYHARIVFVVRDENRRFVRSDSRCAEGDTPAEALLAAYIAALETEAAR